MFPCRKLHHWIFSNLTPVSSNYKKIIARKCRNKVCNINGMNGTSLWGRMSYRRLFRAQMCSTYSAKWNEKECIRFYAPKKKRRLQSEWKMFKAIPALTNNNNNVLLFFFSSHTSSSSSSEKKGYMVDKEGRWRH